MKKNKVTTEDLARMVQGGFNDMGGEMHKRFDKVDGRLGSIENRLDVLEHEILSVKKDLENVVDRREFELIKERVKILEVRVAVALSKKK